MPPGCVRVSVDAWIQPDALIPVCVDGEIETVVQAVCSHVAWPEELIVFPTLVVCMSNLMHSKFLFLYCVCSHFVTSIMASG